MCIRDSYSTLQKYIVPEISFFARNNLVWKSFHTILDVYKRQGYPSVCMLLFRFPEPSGNWDVATNGIFSVSYTHLISKITRVLHLNMFVITGYSFKL